jgi:hypothetical protein
MHDIPPKQTVNGTPIASPDAGRNAGFDSLPPIPPGGFADSEPGALVSVHNAALHANPDSFPVLKAFQDYLEAERNSARKRVVMLSVFFVSLMAVVVAGLIGVGIFLFNHMARQQEAAERKQELLLQAVLQQRAAPATTDPVAAAVQSLEQKIGARLTDVGSSTAGMDRQVAAQNAELGKLKESLAAIQQENAKLRGDVAAIQTRKPAVTWTPPVRQPAPSVPAAYQPPVAVAMTPPPSLAPTPAPAPTDHADTQPATPTPAAPTPVPTVAAPAVAAPAPAPVPTAPKTPLDLPPEGFKPLAPPDGFAEDVVSIPSRVSKDSIRWRLLTPTK